jgi:hypothetical protein
MQVLKIRGSNSPSFPYYATKWGRIKGVIVTKLRRK